MKTMILTIKSLISENTKKVTINGNEYVHLADLGNSLHEKSISIGKARLFLRSTQKTSLSI